MDRRDAAAVAADCAARRRAAAAGAEVSRIGDRSVRCIGRVDRAVGRAESCMRRRGERAVRRCAAEGHAALYARARHPEREAARVVVATVVVHR